MEFLHEQRVEFLHVNTFYLEIILCETLGLETYNRGICLSYLGMLSSVIVIPMINEWLLKSFNQ